MIYILTVHHETDFWIDIQKRYFDKYIKEYRWVSFLDGVSEEVFNKNVDKFFYVERSNVDSSNYEQSDHHLKMDALFDIANNYADDNDIVIFNDSDAFPLKDISSLLGKLKDYPLLAVQRIENAGDKCPHCCFAISTFRFWNKIGGTWTAGLVYNELIPYRQDGGGKLLSILQDNGIDWYKIRRSNGSQAPGDTLFEVYENSTIYHHGGGSRVPFTIATDKYSRENNLDVQEVIGQRIKLSDEMKGKIKNDFNFYKDIL